MTIQSDSGRQNTVTDWTHDFSRVWNCAGILLSLFSRQALCTFLCCSLCATPVWIALLQLGCSLASCCQFMCLILHCFRLCLRTFAPKSSYGEIFFISPLELVHKVLTPKMKKKMGVTDFVSEKMAVEKCLNFDKSVITTRCSLLC